MAIQEIFFSLALVLSEVCPVGDKAHAHLLPRSVNYLGLITGYSIKDLYVKIAI